MVTPSRVTRSCSGSTRRPSVAVSPLTSTRPASIRASQARRDPSPACARTFWSRSPPGSSVNPGRSLGHGVPGRVDVAQRRLPLAGPGGGGAAAPYRVEPDAGAGRLGQPGLELLHDARVGNEVGQGRELFERLQPEPLEEQPARAVLDRMADALRPAELFDVAPVEQAAHDAVDVDTPHGRELGPGDRLLV